MKCKNALRPRRVMIKNYISLLFQGNLNAGILQSDKKTAAQLKKMKKLKKLDGPLFHLLDLERQVYKG